MQRLFRGSRAKDSQGNQVSAPKTGSRVDQFKDDVERNEYERALEKSLKHDKSGNVIGLKVDQTEKELHALRTSAGDAKKTQEAFKEKTRKVGSYLSGQAKQPTGDTPRVVSEAAAEDVSSAPRP